MCGAGEYIAQSQEEGLGTSFAAWETPPRRLVESFSFGAWECLLSASPLSLFYLSCLLFSRGRFSCPRTSRNEGCCCCCCCCCCCGSPLWCAVCVGVQRLECGMAAAPHLAPQSLQGGLIASVRIRFAFFFQKLCRLKQAERSRRLGVAKNLRCSPPSA